jgi:hypothetical protein
MVGDNYQTARRDWLVQRWRLSAACRNIKGFHFEF